MLTGKIALVAGATRAAGRGIAVQLGGAGATVYCSGRTTRTQQSSMGRPETIEETAELVTATGGRGIAIQADHRDPEQVQALFDSIDHLDILVNDIWDGDRLTKWETPFWKQSLSAGLATVRNGIETHLITSGTPRPAGRQRLGVGDRDD